MNLTDKDKEAFRALNESDTGKWLLDYLERLKAELFNPANLTKENLESKKEAVNILEEHLIDRIKLTSGKKDAAKNQFI